MLNHLLEEEELEMVSFNARSRDCLVCGARTILNAILLSQLTTCFLVIAFGRRRFYGRNYGIRVRC
jgi:hypothetical protein